MSTLSAPAADPVDVGDRRRLRGVLGEFPTGVTVVTVGGDAPRGMTANSFTSVSLAPPLLLVCVNNDAVMRRRLELCDTFAVSVLGSGQEAVARHFADHSRPAGIGQFDAVEWRTGPASGAPLIEGALVHLECAKWRVYEAGDHCVFLGEIHTATQWPGQDPLLFHRGQFRRLAAEHRESRQP
ncbi:flavin reductase family protein [Streptomyces cahuitamycinicus]|uniref:Flavin reductase n=1 Tax=Streptomyces cahuitamycinicus TaxID=2070367 RepID=A0A2N8TWW7_9ACTN|nr:flavin reductase family protein [Streptomyces cahuitamycinicus]PNG23515.1 flavin reductase [Streptomyces cahuitamycinicus]